MRKGSFTFPLAFLLCVRYAGAQLSSDTIVISAALQAGPFTFGRDIGSMNPHSYRPNEFVTNEFVFEPLVEWDPYWPGADGKLGTEDDGVKPALAESWTTSMDPYSITFKIKQAVTFHDGEKWTAQAAKINFDHILGGSTKSFAGFHDWYGLPEAISSWEATDETTFVVKFKTYYEPALRELTFTRPFRMISPKSLPDIAKGELSCMAFCGGGAACKGKRGQPRPTMDGKYICRGVSTLSGTGPYQIHAKQLATSKDNVVSKTRLLEAKDFNATCYFPGAKCTYKEGEFVEEVHFKKFSGHPKAPTYGTIILRAFAHAGDIKKALLDGSLDVAYGLDVLSPGVFTSISTAEGGQLVGHISPVNLNTRVIALNSFGALNTPDLRKVVMGLLSDRSDLYNAELGEEYRLDTLFDPKLPYCDVSLDSTVKLAATSSKKVADVLALKPLVLMYIKDLPHHNMIAAWVIKKLSENGISVQPLPADKDTYNANSDAWLGPDYDGVNGTAGFDIVISETWGPNYDPSTKLFDMTYEWGTGEPDAAVTSKMTDPSKNDFTKMVLDATKTKDVAARKKLYQDILTGLHKNALFLPLTAKRNLAVLNKRVSGFRFGHTQYDFPIAQLYPTGAKGKNNIVKMAVSLPMAKETFNREMQAKFKHSVSAAAAVSMGDVVLDEIAALQRRQGNSVRIDTSISAKDNSEATKMAKRLTLQALNEELKKMGLPEATMLAAPSVDYEKGLSDGAIAGIVIGSVVGFLLLVGIIFLIYKEKQGAPVFMELIDRETARLTDKTLTTPSQDPGTQPQGAPGFVYAQPHLGQRALNPA